MFTEMMKNLYSFKVIFPIVYIIALAIMLVMKTETLYISALNAPGMVLLNVFMPAKADFALRMPLTAIFSAGLYSLIGLGFDFILRKIDF